MDPKDTLLFATGVANLILGSLLLLRNKRSQINLSFTFFSFAIAGWALGIAFFRITTDLSLALIWAKEYYISASFTAVALLYFANVFPEGRILSGKKKAMIIGPALLQALLIAIPGYLTKQVVVHSWGKEVILGRIEYLIYTLYFLPFLYGALYILWNKRNKFSSNIKRQLTFICLSILVASIFGVTFNLFLPWFGNYQLIYLGPPFAMIIFWLLSYGIVKHHFFDIRLILARALAFAILLGVIGGFASLAFFFVGSTFFSIEFTQTQLIFLFIATPIIGFNFQLVRKTIERMTDAVFYKGYYDADQLLYSLATVMSTNIDLQVLSEQILQVLVKQMRITRGAFVLFEEKSIYDLIGMGYEKDQRFTYERLRELTTHTELSYYDDLPEGQVKALMRELDIYVYKVLSVKGEIVGLLILGDKASGEIYSDEDLRILNILAPEVSVAIQNAKSYDKIKKFNVTLTQEVQKATADLRVANEKLKELDKLKDDFVSVASHELRTPMTAIKSYSWMALNRPDIKLSDKMKKYLSRTLISTDRLINLVNDMLNISRIESGRVEVTPKPFDIKELVNDVLAEVSAKAAEKNLYLQVLNSQIPEVFADPDKVHQVLLNLVGNALKFTPQGGSITISFLSDGQMVETIVKDSGVGISRDDLSALFKKFGRLDNSYVAAATSGGTGLGLYISKILVDIMKGKIWASSEGVGKGSTFAFSLPIASQKVMANANQYATKVQGEAKALEPVAI